MLQRVSLWIAGAGAGLAAMVLASLVLAGRETAVAQEPTSTPLCQGQDLLAEMRAAQPQAYAEIMRKAGEIPNGGALLWRVEAPGAPPSWLFGTIHMTDPRVHALPSEVQDAFARARSVALEAVNLDSGRLVGAMMGLGELMVFEDGRTLDEFLSPEEAAQAARVLAERGFPARLSEVVKPWLVTLFVSLPDCEQRRAAAGLDSLDARLESLARARGLDPVGLETPEEQLQAMASIPLDAQLSWLRISLKLYEQAEDTLETLVQLYLQRRIAAVWPLTRRLIAEEGLADDGIQEFQRALITIRNERMVNRALPLIEEGGAFIAVGALHLPGQNGLVQLLRDAGYRVTSAEDP